MTTNESQKAVGTEQYSLAKILGIWLLAATPMALLAWVVYPALKDRVAIQPQILFFALNVAGLMWQIILSLTILYRETGTLRLGTIRERTWRHWRKRRNGLWGRGPWSSCSCSCWWAITGWARNSSSAACCCPR